MIHHPVYFHVIIVENKKKITIISFKKKNNRNQMEKHLWAKLKKSKNIQINKIRNEALNQMLQKYLKVVKNDNFPNKFIT